MMHFLLNIKQNLFFEFVYANSNVKAILFKKYQSEIKIIRSAVHNDYKIQPYVLSKLL